MTPLRWVLLTAAVLLIPGALVALVALRFSRRPELRPEPTNAELDDYLTTLEPDERARVEAIRTAVVEGLRNQPHGATLRLVPVSVPALTGDGEPASEHLRNALSILKLTARETSTRPLYDGEPAVELALPDFEAAVWRVARALAMLEGKGDPGPRS